MKPWKGQPTAAEFWAFTTRSGECLLWKGSVIQQKSGGGYGYCWWKGKRDRAHRVAFELATGRPAPSKASGFVIMHACDTPLCVNPKHLRIGTSQENSVDMANKGRAACPLSNAKLDEAKVRAIRQCIAAGFERKRLAEGLGVSYAIVSNLASGRTWQHVE